MLAASLALGMVGERTSWVSTGARHVSDVAIAKRITKKRPWQELECSHRLSHRLFRWQMPAKKTFQAGLPNPRWVSFP